jgi:hypothetical protein
MTENLPAEKLAEIKKRCDQATRGPWVASIEGRDHFGGDNVIKRGGDNSEEDLDLYLHGGTIFDYDFVAHAKQDIPLLLGEIERLQAVIEGLTDSKNSTR